MKVWKLCVCLFLVGMIPSTKIYPMEMTDTSTNSKGIVLLVDEEELKEGYLAYPTFTLEVDKDVYDPSIKVAILNQQGDELDEIDVVWILQDEKWMGEGTYEHELNNGSLVVMLGEHKLYESEMFTIDTSIHEPVLYMNDKKVEGDFFTSVEDVTVKFVFDEAVNKERSSLYINGDKNELSWEKDEKETTTLFEGEGEYEIAYTWYDKLGNEKKGFYHLIIDRKSPGVELYLDDQKIDTLQKFYSKEVVLKLYVEDVLFDMENSKLYRNDSIEEIAWTKEGSRYVGEMKLHEGSHQITYKIKDTLGHLTQKTLPVTTIDTTVPKVTFERKNFEISTQQQLIYTIEESHFDYKNSYLYMLHDGVEDYRKLDGNSTEKGYQGLFAFDDEGDYQVTLVIRDIAGNKTSSQNISFTIDHSAPKLGIFCNEQTMIGEDIYTTNKDVTVTFSVHDETLRSHTITVYKNKQKIVEQANLERMHFKGENQKNDDYVVTLSASDAAGNQSVQQVRFSIYKKVSPLVIENDVFKNKPYANSWTPQIKDDGTQLHVIGSLLYKDHLPVPYQWGDAIKEEGNYALEVIGSDRAMNPTSLPNTFYFTIDKTPPLVTLTKNKKPIPKTLYIKDTLTLSLHQKDNEKLREEHFAYIKINGKAVDLNNQKSYDFTLDSSQEYTISCKVYDDAGNEQVKAWKFHVSKKPILTQHLKVEQIGFVIVMVSSIAVTLYIHGRRKT